MNINLKWVSLWFFFDYRRLQKLLNTLWNRCSSLLTWGTRVQRIVKTVLTVYVASVEANDTMQCRTLGGWCVPGSMIDRYISLHMAALNPLRGCLLGGCVHVARQWYWKNKGHGTCQLFCEWFLFTDSQLFVTFTQVNTDHLLATALKDTILNLFKTN